jgi:hypothetical protein
VEVHLHAFLTPELDGGEWSAPPALTPEEGRVRTIKFLGVQIDNYLNWKSYAKLILPKLSEIYFARPLLFVDSKELSRTVNFLNLHSDMTLV